MRLNCNVKWIWGLSWVYWTQVSNFCYWSDGGKYLQPLAYWRLITRVDQSVIQNGVQSVGEPMARKRKRRPTIHICLRSTLTGDALVKRWLCAKMPCCDSQPVSNCWPNDNKAGYIERCKSGSRRWWCKPTIVIWQGGASLLHWIIFLSRYKEWSW